MNQFILNNLTWLEDNDDVGREKIEEAKRLFLNNTKGIMSKVCARKKQLDMAQTFAEKEEEVDLQNVADMAFQDETKQKISVTVKAK